MGVECVLAEEVNAVADGFKAGVEAVEGGGDGVKVAADMAGVVLRGELHFMWCLCMWSLKCWIL